MQSCNSSDYTFIRESFPTEHNKSLPFNLNSDLFIVQYCGEMNSSRFKIWEVYSVKEKILTRLLSQRRGTLENVHKVVINMTDFLLEHFSFPKVVRRQDLRGVEVTAAAFLNKDDEVIMKI